MKKDSFYFPHDTNASQDPKMMILLSECGLAGIGMYWILVEILHQQKDGKITEEAYKQYIKFFADREQTQQMLNKIEQVLNKTQLVLNKGGYVTTERTLRNMKLREEISNKRSEAGKKSALLRANSTSVEQVFNKRQQVFNYKRKEKKIYKNINNTNVLLNSIESAEQKQQKQPTRLFEVCDLYFQAQRYIASGGKERPKLQDQSKEFIESFIQRNAKSAKLLSPYTNAQIKRAINYCVELSAQSKSDPDGGWDWTLETVGKKIDRVLSPNQVTNE